MTKWGEYKMPSSENEGKLAGKLFFAMMLALVLSFLKSIMVCKLELVTVA